MPYSNHAFDAAPLALTVALSVAPVEVTPLAPDEMISGFTESVVNDCTEPEITSLPVVATMRKK